MQGTEFKRTSILTGKVNSMILPITVEQYNKWANSKELIQEAFPQLTNEQREFLLTGSTQEEWDAAFGGDDE